MNSIAGEILTEDGFLKGYLSFDKKQSDFYTSKCASSEKPSATGIIIPLVINAHTHIGDSFIRQKNIDLPRDIKSLVGPPDGLKHRFLRETAEAEIIQGMKIAIAEMEACGTSFFCDFREQGMSGINQLKKAMQTTSVSSLILSRPATMKYDKKELTLLLQNSNGIGLSSILDWEYSEVQKIARLVHQKKKYFALHASEVTRENIDQILDLHPDFVVHMVHATESDLLRLKQENIPLVICPRSNNFFQLTRDWSLLKKTNVSLMLGTDNAMIANPDILEEIRFLFKTTKVFSLHELLCMATYTPRKALNLEDSIHPTNSLENFIVLDRETLYPTYRVMRAKRGRL